MMRLAPLILHDNIIILLEFSLHSWSHPICSNWALVGSHSLFIVLRQTKSVIAHVELLH